MTWAPGPVVTRRRLGGELKRLRDRSGLKLEDVARQLECSPSKISRLENGKGLPKWRDVRDLLDVYEVHDAEARTRLLEWSQTGQQPMWWSQYADVLPPAVSTYIELEWDASRIQAYESHVVHGLLQTREYARVVLETAWGDSRSAEDLERLVEVRMRRQESLTADHGLFLTCILDESILYRIVGSPSVLQRQLHHLIGMAGAEHVEVRVLPFSAGIIAANLGPFATMGFTTGLDGLVHLEPPNGADILAEPSEVARWQSTMDALMTASLPEQEAVPLLERAVERLAVA